MQSNGRDPKIPEALVERPEFIAACRAHDVRTVFLLARKWGGLSNLALSRMTEIKPESIRKILDGSRFVEDFSVYERIADGLGIPGEMLGLARRPWEQVAQLPVTPDTVGVSVASLELGGAINVVDMRRQP